MSTTKTKSLWVVGVSISLGAFLGMIISVIMSQRDPAGAASELLSVKGIIAMVVAGIAIGGVVTLVMYLFRVIRERMGR
jgi:hypothetical protein